MDKRNKTIDITDIDLSQELKERAFLKFLIDDAGSFTRDFIYSNDLTNCVQEYFRSNERLLFFNLISAIYLKGIKSDVYLRLHDLVQNEDYLEKHGLKIDSVKNELNEIEQLNISDYDENEVKTFLKRSLKTHLMTKLLIANGDGIQNGNEKVQQNVSSQLEKICAIEFDTNLGTDYFADIQEHIDRLRTREIKLSFGPDFPKLNELTFGGLPTDDSCLTVIMAPPHVGKSQLMANFAANWVLQDKKVLLITLEMSEEMYNKRFDALFTDISMNQLHGNEEHLKLKITDIIRNHPNAGLIIKEYPTGQCNANMIRQYLEKLKRTKKFEPDIIVIDYLNIMKPNSFTDGMSIYEKGCRISEEIRALSCELKKNVVTATQANRSGRANGGYAQSDIDLANISESSGISATADAIFAMWRSDDDRINDITHLKILKLRFGKGVGSSIVLSSHPETLKLMELDESAGDADNSDVLDED